MSTVAQSSTVAALDSAQHIRFCRTDKTAVIRCMTVCRHMPIILDLYVLAVR